MKLLNYSCALIRCFIKPRFHLALDCPTKLYYTRKKYKYADKLLDDDFIKALAKGGIQVGELAKYYYPGGTDITAMEHEEALRQTEVANSGSICATHFVL